MSMQEHTQPLGRPAPSERERRIAARIRVTADRTRKVETPEWIKDLAQTSCSREILQALTIISSTPLKDARVEIRVTAEQKQAIEEAAAIEGRTVTEFSATSLVEHALAVIQRERELRVEAAHFDAFTALMDQPARTIDGLRELMSRRSVFVD